MTDLNQAHYIMYGGVNNGNIGYGTVRRGGSTLHSQSPHSLHLAHNYVNNGINDGNDEVSFDEEVSIMIQIPE